MAAAALDNTRHIIGEIAGLSRGRNRAMMAAVVVSSVFGALGMGWAWVEAISSRDRAKVFVVFIDDQSQVVGIAGLNADWEPEDGAYADLARRWIYNFRSRPRDEETLKVQRGEVIRYTDRKLFDGLKASMIEADAVVRTAAVKVDNVDAKIDPGQKSDGRSAVVRATWDEQIMGGGHQKENWSGWIRIVYVPVRLVREVRVNPLGMYVVEYNAGRVGA